ncbi:MAG: hypothetical protein K1X94_18845 [Sandaracinaceae bacterium]|nr:hypothetical protein [Sandaracinaceae bacterium]
MARCFASRALLLAACAWSGCGRSRYEGADTSLDAPGLDAPGLDAPGLDARGLDAPGLDAPGLDAPGLDAPGTDAASSDASGPDAAIDGARPAGCRVVWAQRATGPDINLFQSAFFADDRVYAHALGNMPMTVDGQACDACLVSFSRDGVRDLLVTGLPVLVTGAPGLGAGAGSGGLGIEVLHYALPGFTDPMALGSIGHDGPSSGQYLSARGEGVIFVADYGGTITGVLPDAFSASGMAVSIRYWGGGRGWGRILDGTGDQLALTSRILADGDVGVYVRNVSGGDACLDRDTLHCVPRGQGAAMILSRLDGSVLSWSVGPLGLGSMLTDDRGRIVSSGSTLERLDASGASLWSRPFVGASFGVHVRDDFERGRVLALIAVTATSAYDGTSLAPSTSDAEGLALLEIDAGTGSLRAHLVFGSTGHDSPSGVFVDPGGRIYVAAIVGGDVDLCAGGGGHGGMSDGLLVAID